jgi:predicted nucleotidyltransferase
LMSLEQKIQELVGVKIDLIPASGLKPAIRDQVLSEAIAFG